MASPGKERRCAPGGRLLAGASLGVVAFHLLLFFASCTVLITQARAVESEFAENALADHGGYILLSSLGLLRGYALVSVGYVLFLFPLLHRWASRRAFGFWGAAWRAGLLNALCLGLLFLRLMALKPYFVTQWLPQWDFELVPGGPNLIKDVLLLGLLHGVPLVLLALAARFWIRRGVRFLQEHRRISMPRIRPLAGTAIAAVVVAVWMAPHAIRALTPPRPTPRPNILIIASDSLRADHLSCYGYGRATSPNIDALAARSVTFEHCLTPVGSTLESMVGMLSSQYPHTHGLRHMFPARESVERVNSGAVPKLPEILGAAGYETAVVGDWCAAIFNEVPMGFEDVQVAQFDSFRIWLSQAVYLSHPVIPLYFDNEFGYWLFPKLQSFAHYLRPEVVTHRVIEKLDERGGSDRPFFYTVFTGCNHFAYHAPYPYYQKWTDPKYVGPNKYQVHFDSQAFVSNPEWDLAFDALSPAEKQHIIDLYDGCVTRFDDNVGTIIEALEDRGLLENTIVLVTSDHGEDLFDPGTTLTHGVSFNGGEQGNRVPAILHVPGAAPERVGQLVRNIDIAPTLLELVGLAGEPRFEGQSLAACFGGGGGADLDLAYYGETGYPFVRRRVPGEETLAIPPLDAVTFVDKGFDYHIVARPEMEAALVDSKERCLRAGGWKLVYTPGASGPIHRLYHLPDDPHCQRDLSAEHPEVAERMRAALWRWILFGEERSAGDILNGAPPAPVQVPDHLLPVRWPHEIDSA